jgi:hypothetical protein
MVVGGLKPILNIIGFMRVIDEHCITQKGNYCSSVRLVLEVLVSVSSIRSSLLLVYGLFLCNWQLGSEI